MPNPDSQTSSSVSHKYWTRSKPSEFSEASDQTVTQSSGKSETNTTQREGPYPAPPPCDGITREFLRQGALQDKEIAQLADTLGNWEKPPGKLSWEK
nr:uncharacterized protein CI109_005883 [Kwoniella shandongensis]KAA5525720.1 hypothetical protein CI109_005883 [Kwoniella shandongensis]